MILYTSSVKSHNVLAGKERKKNQHLKSHIIHSGTNKAIDSLVKLKDVTHTV